MHISDTGVLDASAYESADEHGPERETSWAYLAVVVPLVFLYAVVTLLSAVATSASGIGVSWFPVG
jgi:hypothetical protein